MSKGKVIGGSVAAVLLAAAALVTRWEGVETTPYRDLVGVWTVCAGSTTNVQQRQYTKAECRRILLEELEQGKRELDGCIKRDLPVEQWVAVLSWRHNVGTRAACRSTLVRKINEGQPASVWCYELLRWNRAGGREVQGLTNRRKAELAVCLGQ